MDNSAIGSALNIPESALKKIKEADEKLQKIQKTAEQTAASVKASFNNMDGSAKSFLSTLDKIITQLGNISSSATKMSNSLSNAGTNKATQQASNLSGAATKAAESINKMAASQQKATNTTDFSKSVTAWQNIQTQIDATNRRQQELTQSMRQYELTRQRLSSGKGGKLYNDDTKAYNANQKEYEANKLVIASLREKQQAIIANNQALNQQAQMLNALKNYKSDSNSLDNMRSKDTLAAMREYYKEQEKLSAQAAKAAEKAAQAAEKQREREAKAAEKAAEREKKAAERKNTAETKATAASHNQKQTMCNSLFGVNSSAPTTTATALVNSNTARTLQEHVTAIKELQKARLNLNTADKNYKQNLTTLNDAIRQHCKVLKEAGVNTRNLGQQTSYLAGYLNRWAQRTAVAFSIDSVQNFISQIAEVRGQFELSQRSLESIIQNKSKADEIFSKTVELAIQSPFRIKDLVDYTRQLSAYRISADKLYDTTKRLADISAGLGVDMSRLILAYGQVKAASYLRGSEVRQFTEAGVNMYGELQDYFKEVKGEAYSTAQIVDMISKRMVKFEDVEAIFQRMTDKGGMFYNMQQVQANTLYGMLQKLHDAFDVMLNDIGKSNEGTLKGAVSAAATLLKHWEAIAEVTKAVLAIITAIVVRQTFLNSQMGKTFIANAATVGKAKASLMALQTGFTSLGATLKGFAGAAKAGLAGLLIMGTTEAVTTVIGKIITCNKEIRNAKSEALKTKGAIGELAAQYNELAKAAGKAGDNTNSDDTAKNIADKRNTLQKLIDRAGKDGLELKINVAEVKDEDLDKTFNEVEKKYKDFNEELLQINIRYAKSKKYDTLLTDGIGDNIDDYHEAALDFLAQTNKIDIAIAEINSNYQKATAETKKYFDTIRAGQKDGESNLSYYERMYIALAKISEIEGQGLNKTPQWLEKTGSMLSNVSTDFGALKSKGRDLAKNIDNVFGDLKKKFKNDPMRIKAYIDRVAAERDWDQYTREFAYRHFNIDVLIEKDKFKKEVSWVDDYIEDFFAQKKYGLSLNVDKIDDTTALDKFLDKGDKYAKAAKQWEEAEKRIINGVAKNKKEVTLDDDLKSIFRAGDPRIQGKTILVSTLKDMLAEYKKAATETVISMGVKPNEKNDNKEQRDLLSERINLLRDMNSKYDDLIKTESKENALSMTRKYFHEAAQNVGWNANDILPDDASVAKRIKELGKTVKGFTKRGEYFRLSADITLKMSEKEYSELKDDISQNIDDIFSQLQLYKKLKNSGLDDDAIKSMFRDITSSFKEAEQAIDDKYNRFIFRAYAKKYGEDINKWGQETIDKYNNDIQHTADIMANMGEEPNKEYLANRQKLDKQIKQEAIDTFNELTKAYKTQLTDQLQLERWFVTEKQKILSNTQLNSNPELQQEYLNNLTQQYKKKSDENTWKDFQSSDLYIRLFDNIEHAPTKVLDIMAERLRNMRDELKNLDPAQLKAVTQQLQKVEDTRNTRNPFKALASSLRDLAKARKELQKEGGVEKYVSLSDKQSSLKTEVNTLNKQISLQEQLAKGDNIMAASAKEMLPALRSQLKIKQDELNLTDEQVQKVGQLITAEQQAKNAAATAVSKITGITSALAGGVNGLLSALRVTDTQVQNSIEAFQNLGDTLKAALNDNIEGAIAGGMSFVTSIVKIFTDESGIDKEIERQQRAISALQYSYEKLKKSMDDAFDTERLLRYHDKTMEALEKEYAAYSAMIAAEQKRKHPDDSKLQEWNQQLDTLNNTIKELRETMTEELGGFGSQSNYKSAASAFAEAWVDAFNEGEDALDALNDKFDEYFNNLVKKQVAQRATARFIEPILKAFDNAVSEGSEGANNGLDVTDSEITKIKQLKDENLKAYNAYLENFMKVLGVSPTASNNLSGLQQGIQSVTESTAQALESVLNSMRYYLATQQADVRAIRDILIQRLGNAVGAVAQDSSTNPVLLELRTHTSLLTEIRDTIASCVKGGHNQGRNGIKVFMN